MAQYKTGTVFVLNGSNIVMGDVNVDWNSIVGGNWFLLKGSNVSYNVSTDPAKNSIGSYSAYAGGTTYGIGATVASAGVAYVSLAASNVGNTPASSPTWWFAISGWVMTLTTNWAGSTASAAQYGIVTDFTPIYGFPLPQPGDVEIPAIISRALIEIEDLLGEVTIPNTQTGDYTILPIDAQVAFTGTGSHTFTMPNAASFNGKSITVSNMGNAALTMNASGLGNFFSTSAGHTTFSIPVGEVFDFVSINNTWKVQ